jgi:ABC-type transport system involved in cytochrome c biogenesis permease subunit
MPPTDWEQGIGLGCFGFSYAIALALEALHAFRPRPIHRWLALGFGAAGLLAHTLFIFWKPPRLASPFGSLVLLAWVMAVFYLFGSLHYRRIAWGLFVLPLVLAIISLASVSSREVTSADRDGFSELLLGRGERAWAAIHGTLILLAAVGITVGCVASVMYLVQVQRLRSKAPPRPGLRLLSLERLEAMNRHAVLAAFPLLTFGLLMGIGLSLQEGAPLDGYNSPKILSSVCLWVVFAILLHLRYVAHARGRQLALLTLVAFGLMLVSLASPAHTFVLGGFGP